MSEQLAAAAAAMNVPEPLVDRSSRAWADASGATVDEVLAAWAGGEVAAAASAAPAPAAVTEEAGGAAETDTTDDDTSEVDDIAPEQPAPPAPAPTPVAAVVETEVEPEPEVEPWPLGARIRLAGRIGALTGAILGLVGFVVGTTWLLGVASLTGEDGAMAPAVDVNTSAVMVGVVLMSVLFGVVVATLSRAAAGWMDRGAELVGRYILTVVVGAVLGLVLGVAAGAVMLTAFAEPIEGLEGAATVAIVPSLFVVLIGGALLGWFTAALVQLAGVPTGVTDDEAAEIADVRGRLSGAIKIPVAAVSLLALLVLPLGLTFIRSNEMAAGGASVLAIIAAGGILGFAALSASRPTMRISLGEFMVAALGIATVVVIIFAVVSSMAEPHEEAEAVPATEVEEPADEAPTEEPAGEDA